jgi:stage II sporulation protein D
VVAAGLSAVSMLAPAAAQAASTFFIRGGGYGHGIGMSQYGAYGYALHGKNYKFILAHYYQGTRLGHTDPDQTVRVLLGTGSAAFADGSSTAGKQLNPSLTYDVRVLSNGQMGVFTEGGRRVARGAAPLVVTGQGNVVDSAGFGQVRGDLEFSPDGSGGVQTVNALGLDDYVRGVVGAEMPSTWAQQALDAQAVAARTYALTTDVNGNGYDLYDDTRSQMYGGVGAETAATDAAVAATRGQVVTYNGAPVVTYFFSSSGGYTESIQNVWPGSQSEPWLVGVPDPYDGAAGNPYHRWGYNLSLASATGKLGKLVKGSLIGIEITEHGVSPRILAAKVIGTGGTVSVTGIQLQQAFGLQTTLARFTTISSAAVAQSPSTARDERDTVPPEARAFADLVPLVRTLVSRSAPKLTGRVFPAASGSSASLEVSDGGSWKQVATVKLGKLGAYTVTVPGPGTYRVQYAGLSGPAVTVP